MTSASTVAADLPGAILLAANEGDAQTVTAWLEEGGGGVDTVSCTERGDMRLLMAAALGGQVALVRMLLQCGASVNLQDSLGLTALMGAAGNGCTTTVQVLLDAKANASLQTTSGNTPLMVAEEEKHTAVAQLLRQHAKQLMAEAEARAGASATHAAAAADAAAAELLAEVEAEEKEAAAKKGKGKKKKAKAASPAANTEPIEAAPSIGAPKPVKAHEGLPTCMWSVAEAGDAQAVAAWLDEGGGMDARCAEQASSTLLMAATYGGQEATVRMLLQRGASVNVQDYVGLTALMWCAVGSGNTTIVQALLDAKADASLRANNGTTALMWAEH